LEYTRLVHAARLCGEYLGRAQGRRAAARPQSEPGHAHRPVGGAVRHRDPRRLGLEVIISCFRLHAAITHDEETSYVVDLGSAHGTFVDSVRLAANSFHTLHDGARVAFGTAPFDYVIHVNTSRRGAPSSVGQQGSTPKRHRS